MCGGVFLIEYEKACQLEAIVRNIYSCGNGGMGGLICTSVFQDNPFYAAVISLAPVWKKIDCHQLESFIIKWREKLEKKEPTNDEADAFIIELRDIIQSVQNLEIEEFVNN